MINMQHAAKALGIVLSVLILQGCTSAELAIDFYKKHKRGSQNNTDVVAAPRYKVGNPYKVAGIWYYPERNLTYDETGIGSWYGDEFAGKLTANGEIFYPERVTAAHKTLPMPSVVRVTNLDNGKSLVLRINDRGPFVAGRIIDLSREAARRIGYKANGLARVRVQVLAEQSLRLEKLARDGQFPSVDGVLTEAMPKIEAAVKPSVNLTAKSNTGRSGYSSDNGQSAIELLSQSQVGEVITVAPVSTQIWVQVGAFHSESNAASVLAQLANVGNGEVSAFSKAGQTLHRVRLGPVQDVSAADKLLDGVVKTGFSGARIIVD
ncbi:septal ring lytic transglycosylase RlpA family protein [Alphaproteobacteria bacterium]|nr:septal ring lytic transglycosylase RlpA family protein [Alphaproteobacteria bacterium]